ncbi:MAG: hypothetical protein NT123_22100, partial [Proteobacteria bacterium]|nr:hypothetical protein [Pseudomonadota bacterium]
DDANPVTIASVRQAARDAGWVEDMSGEFQPIAPVTADGADAAEASTALAPEPWPALARDKQGRIEAIVDNVSKSLRHEGMVKMRLAYDQFRDEIMYSTDAGRNWAPFKDVDYVTLRITLERRGFKPIGRELIRDVVSRVAEDKALIVVVPEFSLPLRQSAERLFVRRQNQRIAAQSHELAQGIQERLQRILVATGPDRDVGRDLWQYLVAADQNIGSRVIQAQMLGGMSAPDYRSP